MTAAAFAVILADVMLATLTTTWLAATEHAVSGTLGFAGLGLLSGDAGTLAGRVVFNVLALIMCVAVHEFGHAYVADRLGDPLPRMQGRVTLNPLAHIDLLGTVLFPALMALGVGVPLAWGKPVQTSDSARLMTRRFNMRTIRLMISVAGPAMNLGLGLIMGMLFIVAARLHSGYLAGIAAHLLRLNFGLMFFNLLPVPPLDGRSFLAFLPDSLAVVRDGLMRYGGFIFLALIFLGGIGNGPGPLYYLMWPFMMVTESFIGLLMWLGGVG